MNHPLRTEEEIVLADAKRVLAAKLKNDLEIDRVFRALLNLTSRQLDIVSRVRFVDPGTVQAIQDVARDLTSIRR
jgi:hypothetical protein